MIFCSTNQSKHFIKHATFTPTLTRPTIFLHSAIRTHRGNSHQEKLQHAAEAPSVWLVVDPLSLLSHDRPRLDVCMLTGRLGTTLHNFSNCDVELQLGKTLQPFFFFCWSTVQHHTCCVSVLASFKWMRCRTSISLRHPGVCVSGAHYYWRNSVESKPLTRL